METLRALAAFVKRYPARTIGAIQATLVLLIAFGADIAPDQFSAILKFAAAVLVLLGSGKFIHDRVSPVE